MTVFTYVTRLFQICKLSENHLNLTNSPSRTVGDYTLTPYYSNKRENSQDYRIRVSFLRIKDFLSQNLQNTKYIYRPHMKNPSHGLVWKIMESPF
jgi:hypothetical protein